MCDKAVNVFLPTLRFVPDWFVSYKMLEKLDDALFTNDNIIFINGGSNNVPFFGCEMSILSVDLDKIHLDEPNFYEDDPETVINVRLLAWPSKPEQR